MNGLHGIIFSYEQEPGLRELAERRMPASIPFGGRYRVVDFMLSNLHAAGITDEPRRGEMLAAFGENRVVFRGEALEVFYPEGAVPSEETALILGLDYTDEVKALLQPRALPQRAT